MNIKNKINLGNGVFIRDLTDSKFKTMRISVNFILPQSSKTASAYAIIPSLLTQVTKEYPSIDLLSKRLSELYGANLSSSVAKLGDCQILNITSNGISDRFALENECLSEEYATLITKSLFEPLVDENGDFLEEHFKQEKRQILEAMDADFNDKKSYALSKCREIMFKGQPVETPKYGRREDVENLNLSDIKTFLKDILKKAHIEILVLGDANFDKIKESFEKCFNFDRIPEELPINSELNSNSFKDIVEEQKISQSKLIMGFKTGLKPEESDAAKVMSILLGGCVTSKFFLNVREKLSLCYYCSSSLDTYKSAMMVESGIETENIEIARNAILKEIDDVKNGIFTEDDIKFAKLAIINSYKSVKDSLFSTEIWYVRQFLSHNVITPEETEQAINKVTKEEIVESANKLELDTIFVLKGVQNNE